MVRYAGYLPAAAWSAVLLFLGNRPAIDVGPDLPWGADKVAHFAIYGVLGVLSAFGWHRAARSPARALVLAAAILIGAADEWNQRSVPGRSSDPADWVADIAGVAAGFLIFERWTGKRGGKGRA